MLSARKTDRIYLFIFKCEGLQSSVLQKPTAKRWQNDLVKVIILRRQIDSKIVLAWKINSVVYRLHGRKITFAEENIIFASERNKPNIREGGRLFEVMTCPSKNKPLQRNRGHILLFLSIELKLCHSLLFSWP